MANKGNTLGPDQVLDPWEQDYMESSNRVYRLHMQRDGNLVLYDNTGAPRWASNTAGRAVRICAMQGDGNLVIYDFNAAIWATNTEGNPGSYVTIQDDGNLVIYRPQPQPLWASGTAG
jgi:hypothetical protein